MGFIGSSDCERQRKRRGGGRRRRGGRFFCGTRDDINMRGNRPVVDRWGPFPRFGQWARFLGETGERETGVWRQPSAASQRFFLVRANQRAVWITDLLGAGCERFRSKSLRGSIVGAGIRPVRKVRSVFSEGNEGFGDSPRGRPNRWREGEPTAAPVDAGPPCDCCEGVRRTGHEIPFSANQKRRRRQNKILVWDVRRVARFRARKSKGLLGVPEKGMAGARLLSSWPAGPSGPGGAFMGKPQQRVAPKRPSRARGGGDYSWSGRDRHGGNTGAVPPEGCFGDEANPGGPKCRAAVVKKLPPVGPFGGPGGARFQKKGLGLFFWARRFGQVRTRRPEKERRVPAQRLWGVYFLGSGGRLGDEVLGRIR